MALLPLRVYYRAKSNLTGLTNVKGQVYLNQSPKAVGASAVVFTELDATNSPGIYYFDFSAATLAGYGVAAPGPNTFEVYINSATAPAPDAFKQDLSVANLDSLEAHLGTQDTTLGTINTNVAATQATVGTINTNVNTINTNVAAVKADLETGASSLATILSAVQKIQNNAGFSLATPEQFIIPPSGSNVYRIPFTIYNSQNTLIDPDSNSITVSLVNQAGVDRGSFMTGYVTGSPGSAPAVRDSLGQYHVDVTIPSTEIEEELIMTAGYLISSAATARKATINVVDDLLSDGLALQNTLLAVQTTVNDADSKINNATYGLPAANTLQNTINTNVQAVGTQATNLQTDVTNNVKGSGFVAGTDSLHALSTTLASLVTYINSNLYSGGKAF